MSDTTARDQGRDGGESELDRALGSPPGFRQTFGSHESPGGGQDPLGPPRHGRVVIAGPPWATVGEGEVRIAIEGSNGDSDDRMTDYVSEADTLPTVPVRAPYNAGDGSGQGDLTLHQAFNQGYSQGYADGHEAAQVCVADTIGPSSCVLTAFLDAQIASSREALTGGRTRLQALLESESEPEPESEPEGKLSNALSTISRQPASGPWGRQPTPAPSRDFGCLVRTTHSLAQSEHLAFGQASEQWRGVADTLESLIAIDDEDDNAGHGGALASSVKDEYRTALDEGEREHAAYAAEMGRMGGLKLVLDRHKEHIMGPPHP